MCKIDTYRMGEITARLAERVDELEALAYEHAGGEFVLGSPQQVGRILFEQLGLASGRKGKTGYSTDAKVLRAIRSDHEIVPVIEEWRELSKLLNTYLGPLDADRRDDRPLARRSTRPWRRRGGSRRRTRTCRRSRSAPSSAARSARRSSPRRAKLLSADYSQIELRILAHVSGEPKLKEAFARGEDIHRRTAAECSGKIRRR